MSEEPTLAFLCEYFGYISKRRMLDSDEAAAVIGILPGTLRNYRVRGEGPKFVKGPGADKQAFVRYPEIELLRWMYARICQSTSETGENKPQPQPKQEWPEPLPRVRADPGAQPRPWDKPNKLAAK
jgi:hypothetical protein